jgi:hypothetical protein
MLFVKGDVTFKNRKIEKIQHVNYHGVVTQTIPGENSSMSFCDGVRLYRVTLKK